MVCEFLVENRLLHLGRALAADSLGHDMPTKPFG